MLRPLPLLALVACAKVPVVPGPLAAVREVPPEVVASIEAPAEAAVPREAPEVARRGQVPLPHRLADAAKALLDAPYPNGFTDDCSGFVCAAASGAGATLPSSTAALWDLAKEAGTVHRRAVPDPGDLVFFDDTWDRNGNGRLDDDLTHVGIVIDLEPDGTALVAHRSTSQGRTILRINLQHPHDHVDEQGKVLNDFLRRRTGKDKPGTAYLAGELWRAFASVDEG